MNSWNPADVFRVRKPISFRWKLAVNVAGVIIFGLLYSFLSYRQRVINPNDTTIPSIVEIAESIHEVCTPHGYKNKIWLRDDSIATLRRLSIGLLTGSVLGAVIGILMGCYEKIDALFFPIMSFWKSAPATAMLAVFFALVGTGESLFIGLLIAGIVPTLPIAVSLAARQDIPSEKIELPPLL